MSQNRIIEYLDDDDVEDQYGNQCSKDAQTRKQMADGRRSPAPGEVGVIVEEGDEEDERSRGSLVDWLLKSKLSTAAASWL
jgi:hypothetical protein